MTCYALPVLVSPWRSLLAFCLILPFFYPLVFLGVGHTVTACETFVPFLFFFPLIFFLPPVLFYACEIQACLEVLCRIFGAFGCHVFMLLWVLLPPLR
jgi:hypothetical protein